MYSENQDNAKVGVVSIDIKGKSYRLRFTYPEKTRHEFSIARVCPEGWTTAIKAAQLISRDIAIGDFDETYTRYSPRHAKKLELAQQETNKEYNLKELWEMYKEQKKSIVAKTTQNHSWKLLDNAIAKIPLGNLALSKSNELVPEMLKHYSKGTLPRLFDTVNAAVNLAVSSGLIEYNPYKVTSIKKSLQNFKKTSKRSEIQCFEPNEVKAIIAAFYSDEFTPKSSSYYHSWYAPYVEFLALTGCRPEEAIPLTWNDIKEQNDRVFIRFNKAYSKRVLLPHTKNKQIRLFPCNNQLQQLIKSIPVSRYPNKLNLLFPSPKYKYIDQDNFRDRNWIRVINELAKGKRIKEYLKPYCLRHSFITRLVREGVDVATIAALAGNSVEEIVSHYLASRKDYDLPEL